MIRTELDYIHLVFENCEHLDVPGKDIKQLSIRGITKSGSGSNLWWSGSDRWYDETERTSRVRIAITDSFLENKFKDLTGKISDISNGERLKKWSDITWIYIYQKRYWGFHIFNPFHFIKYLIRRKKTTHKLGCKLDWGYIKVNSKSFFKVRIPGESFCYSVAWYFGSGDSEDYYLDSEGKKHCTDYSNKYQTVTHDSEDPITYIDIVEEKNGEQKTD